MKATFLAAMLALMPVLPGEEDRFQSLQEDYLAKAKLLQELDRIVLTDLKIEDQPLEEAMVLMQKKGAQGKPGVINYVILHDGYHNDPFGGSSDIAAEEDEERKRTAKRVSLESPSISFARAVDQLCAKTDHHWSLHFEDDRRPILRIEPKEEVVDTPSKPRKWDMTRPGERDLVISEWYLYMNRVVDTLEYHTGRKFKPVAKVHAGPVEILEEQAAFMKEFLEETERISEEQNAASEKPDQ